jgi:hypothetical protein
LRQQYFTRWLRRRGAGLRRAKSGIARAAHGAKVNLPVNIPTGLLQTPQSIFLAQIAKFESNALRRLYEISVNLEPLRRPPEA